jgi:cyclophilin family peptidyl-prolyl cis-trans isomerase
MEAVSEGELDMADKGMSSRYLRVLPARRKIIASWTEEVERRAIDAARDDLPRVLLETSRGPIVIELYEDDAPNTVANFITLVEDGFYDSTAFHRVVRTFMTQGGDPFTKPGGTGQVGNGHPGWGIADEATPESHRKHFAGAVAMAKHRAPDSGASQFYITHQPTPHLDGRQTVFGRVVSGLEHAQLMQVRDRITSATVIRKRDHEYVVTKIAAYELPNAPSGNLPGWDQNGSPAKPTPSSTAPLPAPPSSPPATPQPQRPSPSTP